MALPRRPLALNGSGAELGGVLPRLAWALALGLLPPPPARSPPGGMPLPLPLRG